MDYSTDELLKLLGLTIVNKDDISVYSLGEAIDKLTEDNILVSEESLKINMFQYYLYLDESSGALTDNTGNTLIYPLMLNSGKFFILDTKENLFL